ncbi:hypothetical protein C9413_25785 [Rhizobium sp. SEMIA 4085]|uniref:hypothetical protein n=1 Tax=Rhizobium TaxID=379 RepID=UPI0005864C65|nr:MULTISPECIES: hypothetical protein [Rhizobium]NNH32732.1 hypothetical protein [Rhizobium sp. SEMIA 4085]
MSALLRFDPYRAMAPDYFMQLGGKHDEIGQIPPFRRFSRATKSIAVEKAGFGVARKPAFA